jgi:polysaccharide export outer membrane protein
MRQADSLLTKKLSAYIKNLSVDVGVETYNSKKVFLIGATGGGEKTYALEGKTRLMDVVGKVGGGGRISRVRVSRGGKIAVVDLHKVWEGGESMPNPILEGGDIIYIPGTEKRTFVTGEVQRPGTYLLPDDATVLEALMQAGGVTNKAAKSKVKIVRGGRVSPIIMSVNLDKIINRGDFERNIILEQDDLIYVPKTRMGSITDTVTQVNPFITSLVFLVGILQLR